MKRKTKFLALSLMSSSAVVLGPAMGAAAGASEPDLPVSGGLVEPMAVSVPPSNVVAPGYANAVADTCYRATPHVRAANAFGQVIMDSWQDAGWCSGKVNGSDQITRKFSDGASGAGYAGWHLDRTDKNATDQFPAPQMVFNTDYHYKWFNSPIGPGTHQQYIHYTYRTGGRYGGEYKW